MITDYGSAIGHDLLRVVRGCFSAREAGEAGLERACEGTLDRFLPELGEELTDALADGQCVARVESLDGGFPHHREVYGAGAHPVLEPVQTESGSPPDPSASAHPASGFPSGAEKLGAVERLLHPGNLPRAQERQGTGEVNPLQPEERLQVRDVIPRLRRPLVGHPREGEGLEVPFLPETKDEVGHPEGRPDGGDAERRHQNDKSDQSERHDYHSFECGRGHDKPFFPKGDSRIFPPEGDRRRSAMACRRCSSRTGDT